MQSSGKIQRVATEERPRETGEEKERQSNTFTGSFLFPPVTCPSVFLTYSASRGDRAIFVLYYTSSFDAESLMI